jgi:hypothetical protein
MAYTVPKSVPLVSCPNVLLIKIWIELMKPIGVDKGHVMEVKTISWLVAKAQI